jgi:hypothetical protein
VIEMSVGQHDSIELCSRIAERRAIQFTRAFGALEQTAINQHFGLSIFGKVTRSGYFSAACAKYRDFHAICTQTSLVDFGQLVWF